MYPWGDLEIRSRSSFQLLGSWIYSDNTIETAGSHVAICQMNFGLIKCPKVYCVLSPGMGWPISGIPDMGWPISGIPDLGWPILGIPDLGWPISGIPDLGWPISGFFYLVLVHKKTFEKMLSTPMCQFLAFNNPSILR